MINEKWMFIKEANDLIEPRKIRDKNGVEKEYAEVKERVIAFRRVHPLGQIITDITYSENYVNAEAMAFSAEGVMLAKGHAREYLKNGFAIEKAETSAIGRALGFCGFGISTSIASAEDIDEVNKPSEIFDDRPLSEILNDFQKYLTKQEQIDLLNCCHQVDVTNINKNLLEAIIDYHREQKRSSKQ